MIKIFVKHSWNNYQMITCTFDSVPLKRMKLLNTTVYHLNLQNNV